MSTALSSAEVISQSARKPRARYFFLILSIFMTAIVLVGFWPSYFGPLLLRENALRPLVIHLHGAVFIGWMTLLLAQVALAATGNIRAHRKLGTFGIAYGCLVLVMGLIVTFAAPILHVREGEWDLDRAAGFLPIPIGDMVLFGGFFGVAIAYRRKPEIHKRLMLLATVALLFAAAGRMTSFVSAPAALLVWFSPLLIGMGYDIVTHRRIHPIYPTGLGVLLVGLLRIPLSASAAWLRIGRSLLRPFI
jgi:hypothetical protein